MANSPSDGLLALLGEHAIEMERVAAFLDGLTHAERVEATRRGKDLGSWFLLTREP